MDLDTPLLRSTKNPFQKTNKNRGSKPTHPKTPVNHGVMGHIHIHMLGFSRLSGSSCLPCFSLDPEKLYDIMFSCSADCRQIRGRLDRNLLAIYFVTTIISTFSTSQNFFCRRKTPGRRPRHFCLHTMERWLGEDKWYFEWQRVGLAAYGGTNFFSWNPRDLTHRTHVSRSPEPEYRS